MRATLSEIHAANELAMQVWRQGETICADYLATRGFELAAIEKAGFQVGHAPSSGIVRDTLAAHGFPLRVAVAAGLIRATLDGTWIDAFRERLVFPVRNIHDGSIAGFSGRALPSAHPNAPRWLNTRTTAAYRKGEQLYGLWEARQAIAKRRRRLTSFVVCEGPLDVIGVTAACPAVAVAPSGTALTATQARWIADLATAARLPVVLAYDGDEAGERAAERATSLIAQHSRYAPVRASLPEGEDPASLASRGGLKLCEELAPLGPTQRAAGPRRT